MVYLISYLDPLINASLTPSCSNSILHVVNIDDELPTGLFPSILGLVGIGASPHACEDVC